MSNTSTAADNDACVQVIGNFEEYNLINPNDYM